ncbi:MAG: hypothetical protein Q4G30_01015 [Actinomycetaceae bacterium]|nr:hypothetical protein [Actinomycetaceae bacterium]
MGIGSIVGVLAAAKGCPSLQFLCAKRSTCPYLCWPNLPGALSAVGPQLTSGKVSATSYTTTPVSLFSIYSSAEGGEIAHAEPRTTLDSDDLSLIWEYTPDDGPITLKV